MPINAIAIATAWEMIGDYRKHLTKEYIRLSRGYGTVIVRHSRITCVIFHVANLLLPNENPCEEIVNKQSYKMMRKKTLQSNEQTRAFVHSTKAIDMHGNIPFVSHLIDDLLCIFFVVVGCRCCHVCDCVFERLSLL